MTSIWAPVDHQLIQCYNSTVQIDTISLPIVLAETVNECLLQSQKTFTAFPSTEGRGVPTLTLSDNF